MDSIILGAARTADLAHMGQKRRDGEPYINHPMRVAGIVTLTKGVTEELIAAAWLHDVLEDTEISSEYLNGLFGQHVLDLVVALTNVYIKDDYPLMNRGERKQAEAMRLSSIRDGYVHTLKLADRLDNIHGVLDPGCGRKWARKYVRETHALLDVLDLGDDELRHMIRQQANYARRKLS